MRILSPNKRIFLNIVATYGRSHFGGQLKSGFAKGCWLTEKDRPVGQVFVSDDKMLEVWTLTWTEVLHNAKARLEFINKALIVQTGIRHANI